MSEHFYARLEYLLADACFHESTICGLLYYSRKGYPQFKETAYILTIIRDWFNLVNVKSKYDAGRTKDHTRIVVEVNDREQLFYLRDFYSWLQAWSHSKTNCLSSPTFHAAKVTTINFINIVNYLLDKYEHIHYVTFGKITQDDLEGRFGWYRQLSGGNYYASVRQFLQAEKKIRVKSLVKMGFLISDVK